MWSWAVGTDRSHCAFSFWGACLPVTLLSLPRGAEDNAIAGPQPRAVVLRPLLPDASPKLANLACGGRGGRASERSSSSVGREMRNPGNDDHSILHIRHRQAPNVRLLEAAEEVCKGIRALQSDEGPWLSQPQCIPGTGFPQ